MALGSSLTVDLSDLHRMDARVSALSDGTDPPDGSALLAIDRFGFSANNVTYATNASALGFWSFFPAPDGTGHIPVWAHLTVLRSAHEGISAGDSFYGLAPMATHLLVSPSKVGPRGFSDDSPNRRGRAPVYNRYLRRGSDPVAAASPSSALEVLARPQFTTSFLLAIDLGDHSWYGADAIVVTSASSRTASGLAHVIGSSGGRPALVGLTRSDHVTDVRRLGCYDRVLPYEEATSLPVVPTALVDLSGDGAVIAQLHRHLGDTLTHSAVVGATHRPGQPVDTSTLPGAPRTFFLAPEVAGRLTERVGEAVAEQSLADAWGSFATAMQDWMRIHEATDIDTIRWVYEQVLSGSLPPRDGWVLSLRTRPGGGP